MQFDLHFFFYLHRMVLKLKSIFPAVWRVAFCAARILAVDRWAQCSPACLVLSGLLISLQEVPVLTSVAHIGCAEAFSALILL